MSLFFHICGGNNKKIYHVQGVIRHTHPFQINNSEALEDWPAPSHLRGRSSDPENLYAGRVA